MFWKGNHTEEYNDKNWWKTGLGFGLFMFVLMELMFPVFSGDAYTSKKILTGLIVWLIGGLIYGLGLHLYFKFARKS